MPSECKKCGGKDNYNFALNIGLCDPCIGAELEQLEADNKRLKEDLRKFGCHSRRCDYPFGSAKKFAKDGCKCGWLKIEQALIAGLGK